MAALPLMILLFCNSRCSALLVAPRRREAEDAASWERRKVLDRFMMTISDEEVLQLDVGNDVYWLGLWSKIMSSDREDASATFDVIDRTWQ